MFGVRGCRRDPKGVVCTCILKEKDNEIIVGSNNMIGQIEIKKEVVRVLKEH